MSKLNREDISQEVELEYCFYARFNNLDEIIKNAISCETQEQYEVNIPNKGRMRVRCTNRKDYEFTMKVYRNEGGCEEINIDCDATAFQGMKALASSGMIKERYVLEVEGHPDLKWEFDLFPRGNRSYSSWVKIDLEVKSKLDQLPSIPFNPIEVIKDWRDCTPEEETYRREITDKYFVVKV